MLFKPGHAKVGGRRKGTPNKSILARRRAIVESMHTLGLQPEVIDAITLLAIMRLVMVARLRAGDEHADMSDEELRAEIVEVERRIAETLH